MNAMSHNPEPDRPGLGAWTLVGENVGAGPEVGGLMDAFVASPTHYANIVEPRFDYIGVGVTWGSDGRMYTTHVFMDLDGDARPRRAPAPEPDPGAEHHGARGAHHHDHHRSAAAPAPAADRPPPAAAAPERVAVVLDMVGALGDGVQ